MASGISVIPGISLNLGLTGSDTGLAAGPGVSASNLNPVSGGQALLADDGTQIQTDAGVDIHTSN